MKTFVIILISLFTLPFSLFGQTGSEYYLPLQIGNYLVYDTPGNNIGWGARTTREFIDGTDTIGGHVYFRQIGTETDQFGTDTFHVFWLRKDQSGSILIGAFSDHDNTADSAMILDPPFPYFTNQYLVPGYVLISEWGKDSVMSKTETVHVPAGMFQNCLKIQKTSFDDSGKVRVNEYVYYARNIGEVKCVRTFPETQAHTRSATSFQTIAGDTVRKYVAVGDGFTAGWQDNALYQSAQLYSFPNVIAAQLKSSGAPIGIFELPWYSDPGTVDPLTGKAARFEIISLSGPVIGPKGLAPGSPTNNQLNRPYDNLGIHGAVIYDLLDTTSIAMKAMPYPQRNNPMFQLVLRDQSLLGKRLIDQIKVLNPDLITFWLGSNDLYGYATAGGTQSIYMGAAQPTSNAVFSYLYRQALDSLRRLFPNTRIVTATIPDVLPFPFFTTVGPRIAASIPAAYPLRYQKHGVTGISFDTTRLTENGAPLVCLTAVPFTSQLGLPSGAWYRYLAQVLGGVPVSSVIGAGIDTTKAFGFDPRNPFPDALVLDASEQAVCADAVSSFNATIRSESALHGMSVFDAHSYFSSLVKNGLTVNGVSYSAAYLFGRFFSLDGVRLSSRGNGLLANEFITTMNTGFGLSIPLVDISAIPDIAGLTTVQTQQSHPENYIIEQNFPNPFNPSTTIRYALPSSAHVRLTIHDVLGREIATLVNEEQSVGWNEIKWNADAFANGMYFYRLSAGRFIETRKMLLMK
jgi:hypothetical protein